MGCNFYNSEWEQLEFLFIIFPQNLQTHLPGRVATLWFVFLSHSKNIGLLYTYFIQDSLGFKPLLRGLLQ